MLSFYLVLSPLFIVAQDQPLPEKYHSLPFGSIKPSGWVKSQMEQDLDGFVGHLDQLVPDLMNDPIYSTERLTKNYKMKDLGNLKSGDAGGDEQYKWWNSETQSNWWDGYIRNALLLEDQQAIKKVQHYIDRVLSSQDDDGYLGIYDKELRYSFTGENGELWSKTTLYRGLIAYYEYTRDTGVWTALVRAVDNVMQYYPVNQSQPFYAGKDFSGGVAHGLTFTDVMDKMYLLTGNQKYREYAAFLYRNFCENYSSEQDVQLHNILDANYSLQAHGVHTYEHLRPLIIAAYATGSPELVRALQVFNERIRRCTTPTGGAIGDEWIAGRQADATHTGYEYCSLHELLDSYSVLFQKSGDVQAAEQIETIFFNAAQGSRNPDHSCIAYLKTDNSYEMLGTKNGEVEPGRVQTRYKYSPVHKDVAVCCVPNAGRITPYFLQNCWFKEGDHTLVASLLCPNILQTTINNIPVKIEVITAYPYQNHLVFRIETGEEIPLKLKIRKPGWAESVRCNELYQMEEGFLVFERSFRKHESIEIEFLANVKIIEDLNNEKFFRYGALFYAKPIAARVQKGQTYAPGFEDLLYSPVDTVRYEYIPGNQARFQDGKINVSLRNSTTQKIEQVDLIPFSKTVLRQVSFR